tara:strand:+ start:2277 stop:3080 length:804 start_codon:yes stop_codon:yes gene_type:complete
MTEISLKLNEYKLSISENINSPLMICSHERSGTHYLMNSIANGSDYVTDPFLNFDYHHIGAAINFFSADHVSYFFRKASAIKHQGKIHCMNSLVKSHFDPRLLEKALIDGLKVAYIFREPSKVFLSYWRLINNCKWFEAPLTKSPLELAKHIPAGRSQKYQFQNYSSYFERWAMHVSSALKINSNFTNFQLVYYDDLLNDYHKTIDNLFTLLSIVKTKEQNEPRKDNNYVLGADTEVTETQINELQDFCKSEIIKYPDITEILRSKN